MAATSYYEKVGEDEDHVEYRYGPEPSDMAGSLTIDKRSLRPRSANDRLGLTAEMAAGRILRTYRERDEWPERGASFI